MNAHEEAHTIGAGKNLLRSVWAVSEDPADGIDGEKSALRHLGWILTSAAIVMFAVVSLGAYLSIRRSEEEMSSLLAEKGSSLLMVFESALRTGMRGSSGVRLQTLLEEMTRSPDVEFVAVTMPTGVIIAHSDRGRIGESLQFQDGLLDAAILADLAPVNDEKWKIVRVEGKRLFLLYRHFTLGRKDWPADVPEPTIFLGMDVSPFEITRGQNRTYVIMLSIVILLVGLACLLAITNAQRAHELGKRKKKAEQEVERLEKEMRRQEKLAAMGTLAAGVAHEIRNPLSSIKGYATYFRQRFPEGSEDREAASVMLNEINRLNRVISDLLGLSAKGELKLKPISLENVVAHVARLLRQNASDKNVVVKQLLAHKIPLVLGDMEKLSQALLNLCLNAFEAMPNGGTLTIAVSGGKKGVCLIVKDTGAGIAPEIMNKIFDPYFTTKGSGTGLGLPMVHKIISGHKGRIEIASRMASGAGSRGGTIFKIWLPVAH